MDVDANAVKLGVVAGGVILALHRIEKGASLSPLNEKHLSNGVEVLREFSQAAQPTDISDTSKSLFLEARDPKYAPFHAIDSSPYIDAIESEFLPNAAKVEFGIWLHDMATKVETVRHSAKAGHGSGATNADDLETIKRLFIAISVMSQNRWDASNDSALFATAW
jgi:hypothetical protein